MAVSQLKGNAGGVGIGGPVSIPFSNALNGEDLTGVNDSITANAGSTRLTGTLLEEDKINIVTAVDTAGDSLRLPVINNQKGTQYVIVRNNDAAEACDVFPHGAADTIDAVGAGLAQSLAIATTRTYVTVSATGWKTY